MAQVPIIRRFNVLKSFNDKLGVSSFWVGFAVPVFGLVVFRFASRSDVARFLVGVRSAVRWWRSFPKRYPLVVPGSPRAWGLASWWSLGGRGFSFLPRFGFRWLVGWSRFVVVCCPYGKRAGLRCRRLLPVFYGGFE